jgi:lysophospholipase L1-like esterase
MAGIIVKNKFHLINLILIHSLVFLALWKAGFFGKIIDELDIAERKVIRYIRSLEIQQIDLIVQKNNIIFLGDSFISNFNVSAIHPLAVNFGIGGNTTEDVLYKVKDYKSLKKVKSVFLNVGINDLLRGKPADEVHSNIKKIIRLINGRVFLGSIHPLDERVKRAKRTNNREISELNSRMASFCRAEPNCFFVDAFSYLIDETGNLDPGYHTDDGFHLSPAGYKVWMTQMKGALQPEHYKDRW